MPVEFDECPWVDYTYRDELPIEILGDDGPVYTDRYALLDITRRVYSWHIKRTTTERAAVDAFMALARSVQLEAFYIRDPKDDARTAVTLEPAVGDGARVTFSLPTTGEERRHYPRDDADLVVRVGGAPATVASVDTDARTITLAAPPGIGVAVEADYNGLRLCRLSAPFDWKGLDAAWFDATLVIEEIITD